MKTLKKILVLALLLMMAGVVFAGGAQEAEESTTDAAPAEAQEKVKVGFVYIGPAGDFGWTYAHDQGRQYIEDQFPWVETMTVESVPEGDAVRFIDRMVQQQKCDIIITTSFGYMDDTVKAAAKYPDIQFYHCSGFKRAPNMGTFMGDMYQIYYLNGLMAGAMTESNKIGYVAAFPIPELFRHMNAFALGIKEANPDAEVHVKWIYAWYGPDKAREAAEALVAEGCDVLGFTEDTPTVLEVAQEHYEKGEKVYGLSHYSPMQAYAEDATLTGQLTDWGVLYERILNDYKAGKTSDLTDYDLLYLMEENAVELGASWEDKINPAFVADLKAKTVNSADFGDISVYDLVMKRYAQMKEGRDVFDPFMGPIYDQEGNMTVAEGEMASIGHLFAEMMYQVDNFATPLPQ